MKGVIEGVLECCLKNNRKKGWTTFGLLKVVELEEWRDKKAKKGKYETV